MIILLLILLLILNLLYSSIVFPVTPKSLNYGFLSGSNLAPRKNIASLVV
jgi:hypothetical protein